MSTHPSKTDSALRSCEIKSDDFKSMYTSAGDVHRRGCDEGKSQAASYVFIFHIEFFLKTEKKRNKGEHAFGEEKFSLGNTPPPYASMAARIWASSSGNA